MERKASCFKTMGRSIRSLEVKESRDLLIHTYKQISPVKNTHKIRAKLKGKISILQYSRYNSIHYLPQKLRGKKETLFLCLTNQ